MQLKFWFGTIDSDRRKTFWNLLKDKAKMSSLQFLNGILNFESLWRESNVRLRGEGGIVKKKLQGVMKDTDEYKTNIAKMTTENQKLHSTIKNMEKDISDLKNEIKIRWVSHEM